MKTLEQLTATEAVAAKALTDIINALEHGMKKASQFLEANPAGGNLYVVVLNEVYTIGLEADKKTLKLNNKLSSVGYNFDLAVAIKRTFRGKDGAGREIQTSEITVRNARKYMLEIYNSNYDQSLKLQKALDDLMQK